MPPDYQNNNSFLINLKNNLSLYKALKILVIAILLIGLPAGLYLVQQTQIFKPKASAPQDQIDLLTEQLLQADQKYDLLVSPSPTPLATPSATPTIIIASPQPVSTSSATPQATSSAVQAETTSKEAQEQLNSMKGIAIRRKELLLQKIKENPQEFLDKATLTDKINTFPESIKPYIEEKIQTQGKLTVVHIDDFDNKKSRYEYFLEKSDKKDQNRYKLYFVKDPPQILSGSEVKVNGVELDQQVALATGNAQPNQEGLQIIAAATLPPAKGEQKTAVLLVNFSDAANQPVTKEQIQDLILSTSNSTSINNFYKENSFNKMYLSGAVYGWYTVSYTQCNDIDDIFRIADLANETFAREEGSAISNRYKRVIYILNISRCIGVMGQGTIGGFPISQSWLPWDKNRLNISVYAHELGHNLGTHHANSWQCPLGIYNNCSNNEYGDKYDVMGKRAELNYAPHFNAPHKVSIGWLEEGLNLKSVSQDGIYTIAPLEVNKNSLQVLRIRKPDTNEYYFISYRQRIGFDNSVLDYELVNGASIHIWNEDSFIQTKYLISGIYTNNFDYALADGKVFNDTANGISIKQISHTISSSSNQEGSVTVEIRGSSPIPTSPSDHRRVFITSSTYNGNFGSVELADATCQRRANEKALGGEWKAWMSDSLTSPELRFVKHNIPYKLLNGQIIANNWTDLIDGILQNPINIDENITTKPPDSYVWTGTHPLGFKTQPHCNNWTAENLSIQGVVGNTRYRDSRWSYEINRGCGLSASLYCFEQTPLTTPTPTSSPSPTPTPTTYSFIEFLEAFGSHKTLKDPQRYNPKYDVNSDGGIDIVDFSGLLGKFDPATTKLQVGYALSELIPTYNKKSTEAGFNPKYDLNTDKVVNKPDYIILNTENPSKTSPCPPIGDVNDDKVITDEDRLMVQKMVAGGYFNPTADQIKRADVNGDGKVTSTDSLSILRYIKGADKTFKACTSPTLTPTPKPTTFVCNACAADINKNKGVDIGDYSFLITCYNKKSTDKNIQAKSCAPADINSDGKITGADFSCLTSQFGKRCQ